MDNPMLGYLVVFGTVLAFMWLAWSARAKAIDDFYVAGRRETPFWNGMAIAADWISAASFIGLAGALGALGYDGLAYIIGWTGGYVLLAVVVAPYLRRFGKYTTPGFVGDRYESSVARALTIFCAVVISFVYCVGQIAGCGIIMARFVGLSVNAAIAVAVVIVAASTVMGGLKSTTSTQCTRYVVLMVGYLVPVTAVCVQWYGHPFSQVAYGDVIAKIVTKQTALGIAPLYTEPFARLTGWDMWVLTLVLMVGTAGLPHIMMRFFSMPTTSEARSSAGWALVFVGALYFTAPAYAAFHHWMVLNEVVGHSLSQLPEWVAPWIKTGLLAITDANGDGIVQHSELRIHQDMLVLSMPELAKLPYIVSALLAAGGLAAAISTADGLLLVIAGTISRDLYQQMISPNAPEGRRALMAKGLVVLFGALAGVVAALQLGSIVQTVAWAFSIAAATVFPAIFMGIFCRRTSRQGVIIGMVGGLLITLFYIGAVKFGWPVAMAPILGIRDQGAGFFGMVFHFASSFAVSRLTSPPSEKVTDLFDQVRLPRRTPGYR